MVDAIGEEGKDNEINSRKILSSNLTSLTLMVDYTLKNASIGSNRWR